VPVSLIEPIWAEFAMLFSILTASVLQGFYPTSPKMRTQYDTTPRYHGRVEAMHAVARKGRHLMDMRIELIPVPVTDVDRAKAFYVDLVGFNADHDHRVNENLRFVQLTPRGSACSIVIGDGITEKEPGTQEIQVVIQDAQAAYRMLTAKGVEATEPETLPWGIFVNFRDPDGNSWALQQIAPA